MSLAYDTYIKHHLNNVMKSYDFFHDQIDPEKFDKILPDINHGDFYKQILIHDSSKESPEEYQAYDNYFYRGGHATKEGKEAFDYAWNHHIANNPHHWQYWALIHDDGDFNVDNSKIKALEMPDNYILEMICDWWSFSWSKYDETHMSESVYEIFNWYDSHKNSMILGKETKTKVESLLDILRNTLDEILAPVDTIGVMY